MPRYIDRDSSHLWILCYYMCGRPRLLDPASASCAASADGPQGESCGYRRFGDGSYVSKPEDFTLGPSRPSGKHQCSMPSFRTSLSTYANNVTTQCISSHNRSNPLRPHPRRPVRLSLCDRRHRHLVLQRNRPRHHSSLLRRPPPSVQRAPRFQPLPQLKGFITRRYAALSRPEQRDLGP